MERDTDVVRAEKAGGTVVRISHVMIMAMRDLDKPYRYQIVTDPHRNHARSGCGSDSVVPQERSPLS